MGFVIYGKHPGFGDFVSQGLDAGALTRLDAWVQGVLPDLRAGLGEAWAPVWDAAPVLRLWLGADILGVPFQGVWAASRDRVGRRYPLIFGVAGRDRVPPVHPDHDADLYAALVGQLAALAVAVVGQGGVRALLEALGPVPGDETLDQMPPSGMLWGQRADGDLGRLMRDAAELDAQHAQCGRSHWWSEAGQGRPAAWVAVTGLPDADVLHWLLVDARQEAATAQEDDVSLGGE